MGKYNNFISHLPLPHMFTLPRSFIHWNQRHDVGYDHSIKYVPIQVNFLIFNLITW